MKNILFYLESTQPCSSGKRHGGGRYGEIVFKRIVERNFPVVAFYNSSKWFNPEIKKIIDDNKIKHYDAKNIALENAAKQSGVDRIYFPTEVYGSLMEIKGCELYGTVHGLRAMELKYDPMMLRYKSITLREKIVFLIKRFFPKYGYKHAREHYELCLAKKNFHFAMVSNHSCGMMEAFFSNAKNREIPCFYSPSTSQEGPLERKYPEEYFLMVSGNRWEKNVLRGIIAFDRLFSMGYLPGFVVKITGAKSIDDFAYKIKNKDRFDFYGYVDDFELEQLYHDAYAFVYPTLNEGFGYPPLEAMHYGVPVLTSSHTSIPEVCGDAVLYFNPFSIEEIMARILRICNKNIHKEFSEKALNRYAIITRKQKEDLDGIINFIYG